MNSVRAWVDGHRTAAVAVVVAVVATLVAGGTAALAAIPSTTTGAVTACVTTKTGAVRIIDYQAGKRCTSLERTVSWGKGYRYRGAWSAGTAYAILDVVTSNGSSYVALAASKARTPATSTTFWGLLAARGATGAQGPPGAAGTSVAGKSCAVGEYVEGFAANGDLVCKALPGPSATPTVTVTSAPDTDGDGVPDSLDPCPQTPDAVLDTVHYCPATMTDIDNQTLPAGSKVVLKDVLVLRVTGSVATVAYVQGDAAYVLARNQRTEVTGPGVASMTPGDRVDVYVTAGPETAPLQLAASVLVAPTLWTGLTNALVAGDCRWDGGAIDFADYPANDVIDGVPSSAVCVFGASPSAVYVPD